ncbi:MAG: hypothetical protein IJ766_01860 [Clostridia bacterium]|nr:hypothetical protein [Clostridia bacterium]
MTGKKKPTIHTAATAHLDTVWNWDFETTISEYLKKTLDMNFRLFEKYPEYVFSFEGSRRYELMEEYYPIRFDRLRKYIAEGRWHVTGSAYENGDVNVPSPEALFRNILFGQDYFIKKFGVKSVDIYLPDCFGFGWALPSIMKHAGLLGFTTQKLTWGSAYGIPFDLGIWKGVDGAEVFASLNPFSYTGEFKKIRKDKKIADKLADNLAKYDLPMTYTLHGTGDTGGAPTDRSVRTAVTELRKNEKSDVDVAIDPVDRIFSEMHALPDEAKAKLPVWNNELVATDHGVGAYTSRTIGKRWNKRNEQLADAAERAAVAAAWLGTEKYPADVLNTAWKRVIAHQFHDDITGTSLQRVYHRSWNDYMLSLNQFGSVYEAAVENIASLMTVPRTKGIAVAVSNPTDTAVAEPVAFAANLPKGTLFVKVKDKDGKEVPAQYCRGKVIFIASAPGNSVSIYTVLPALKPYGKDTGLRAADNCLENYKYKLSLNANGDIASIYDKELGKELLKAPISMDIHAYKGSKAWPSWELDYPEVIAAPIGKASEPTVTLREFGPARAVLETVRHYGDSVFVQRIILGAYSPAIRVENEIEWRGRGQLLKTPFTFTVENEQARYDLGLGVIARGTDTPKLYEVPAQNWADISGDDYGVAVFSECKNGWDHPAPDTIRLTGIHTPLYDFRDDSLQSMQDLGKNIYAFGVYAHGADGLAEIQKNAAAFVNPLSVFAAVPGNKGPLGGQFVFSALSDNGVLTKAIKKELNGSRTIIRVQETAGKAHTGVRLEIGAGIAAAVCMNAIEEELGAATVENGALVFDIAPYQPLTFALALKPSGVARNRHGCAAVDLPLDINVYSAFAHRHAGAVGGYTIPAEQFVKTVTCGNAVFQMADGKYNALAARGQTLRLPAGTKEISFLATSACGDKHAKFICDGEKTEVYIPDCFAAIGAWDLYGLEEKGRIKNCRLAHAFTHMHAEGVTAAAKQCYLFSVTVKAQTSITLPFDPEILVFAAAAFDREQPAGALQPLYDTLEAEPFDYQIPEALLGKVKAQ